VTGERVERRLAAVLAADIAGYSRLMGADEVGTLQALKAHRRELIDPSIAAFKGRIVKTTGDGMLVEFASAVDAVTCAMAVQSKMEERNSNAPVPISFRIGINIGDIIIDGDDIYGDGVNVAARVENECEPGGVLLSGSAFEQVRGKTEFAFDDLGERSLKNIERPVRLYAARLATATQAERANSSAERQKPLPLPDKPSVAVLPFQNMSGDPEQEYFADGIVEDIITALSRFKSLFVIARNSSFTYKGKAVDIKQVGRELGVRYVLEGSVRKSAGRVRITGQLIDSATGAHVWADRYDGKSEDVFDLQDQITVSVVGQLITHVQVAEIERANRKPTANLDAYDCFWRGLAQDWKYNRAASEAALAHFLKAIELDENFALAHAHAATIYALRKQSGWMADVARESAEAIRLARRAIELGHMDEGALCGGGLVLAYVAGELDLAAECMRRGLEMNPNYAVGDKARGYKSTWVRMRLR
jgi:adenylate cyclase